MKLAKTFAIIVCYIACVSFSYGVVALQFAKDIAKKPNLAQPSDSQSGKSTGVSSTEPQEKDKALIQDAMARIKQVNPNQKGGWVAKITSKDSYNERGELIQFDEDGNILSRNGYVRGKTYRYGEDNIEYMSMPYGKSKCVWQDANGNCLKWSDTDGQWVNADAITVRVGNKPDCATMSPGMTIERVHPLSSSGTTGGCYGLEGARYGAGDNSQSMVNFANSRVYLGRINGISSNGNQCLAGYRTPVGRY